MAVVGSPVGYRSSQSIDIICIYNTGHEFPPIEQTLTPIN